MKYRIAHHVLHEYSKPVFLERHTFRFRPREDGTQRVTRFDLTINPKPSNASEGRDISDNSVLECFFNDPTEFLRIAAMTEVETLRENPFDFLVEPIIVEPVFGNDELSQFALECFESSERDFYGALHTLNSAIYSRTNIVIRDDGSPQSAIETLTKKEGACRDVAVLFCDVAKIIGLPSRFVSGYQVPDPGGAEQHLHAWAEVCIPGGGWRGFDPTHGVLVGDRHVSIAASYDPADANPISGTFRGTGAIAKLSAKIVVEASANGDPVAS